MKNRRSIFIFAATFAAFLVLAWVPLASKAAVFSPEDALKIKYASSPSLSPDGSRAAFLVRVPRKPDDKPGSAYSELHVVSLETANTRPFVTGDVHISSPLWSPDGSSIAFLTKKGDKAKTQVWVIPVDGGESFQATHSKTDVSFFRWHPDSRRIAYIASSAPTKREEKLKKKGYGFIYFEENLKPRNLYITSAERADKDESTKQLTDSLTAWSFTFNTDGGTIAAAVTDKNLIDHRYMFQQIHLLDTDNGNTKRIFRRAIGKLGNYSFSPDGKRIAYTAALDSSDHAVSQLYVMNPKDGRTVNLTPPDYRGHINWVGWRDDATLIYKADEGVNTALYSIKSNGRQRKLILDSKQTGVIFGAPAFSKNRKHFCMLGSSPSIPSDLFYWRPGKRIIRMTTLNPWISERSLGRQEVFGYTARDGEPLEGILVYPVEYDQNKKYPLVITVHGGPESHYSNRWLTGYFQPAQVFSSAGYAVFHPNYRSSTGYGVDYGMVGHGDAAGKEFDDIADAIDALVDKGIADRDRIGLGGGSYGGFAAAWFSSYYTRYVKAVCMFVGISDLISKRGTTDIPYEELYVHSGKKLEDMWEMSLKRSPIYWAHKSQTAVLILGGASDTRVSPSQSIEYYTRLKMNNHPAVRLVKYPGEGHGNRKQTGRADVLYRSLEWFNWYVRDAKPIDGPMPPLDISGSYGLNFDE